MHVQQLYLSKYSKASKMEGRVTIAHDNGSTQQLTIEQEDMPEILNAIGKALVRAAAHSAQVLADAARHEIDLILPPPDAGVVAIEG